MAAAAPELVPSYRSGSTQASKGGAGGPAAYAATLDKVRMEAGGNRGAGGPHCYLAADRSLGMGRQPSRGWERPRGKAAASTKDWYRRSQLRYCSRHQAAPGHRHPPGAGYPATPAPVRVPEGRSGSEPLQSKARRRSTPTDNGKEVRLLPPYWDQQIQRPGIFFPRSRSLSTPS